MSSNGGAGRILAAVLLPPLGVWLAGGGTREFALACGLTILGFVPGVAFALWSVLRPRTPVPA